MDGFRRLIAGLGAGVAMLSAGGLGAAVGAAGLGARAAAALAPAATSCPQAPTPGVPVPVLAPRDPVITELGLDSAWALTTGRGVTVGVVDTGVDPSSPKLAGAVDPGETLTTVATPAVFSVAPNGTVDCDGHGTEVAGIIAGRTEAGDDRVSGVAPAARIYPVAIQGMIGQAPAALIARAIRDAAEHAGVVNLSFAQPADNPEIRRAVAYALSRNVVVVAAAANEGAPGVASAKSYPAAYPGVLAVAAVQADGSPTSQATGGSWISVAAPGAALTTVPRGGKGYVTVTGTSFATAIVSGTAALVRARFPAMPAAAVVARIKRTAVPPGDGNRDDVVGFGVIDPYAALTMDPAAPNQTGRAGAVAVLPLPDRSGGGGSSLALAATAVLVTLAILFALGALSVRTGRRRGWVAGHGPPRGAGPPKPKPQPAELGSPPP